MDAAAALEPLKPLGGGIDYHGEVYLSGDRVIRAIRPQYAEFYSRLVDHPAIVRLVAEGILIPVTRSERKIDDRPVVLEHPRLPQVSYPFEWPATMLRDAAATLLRLNLELMEHGLCLEDGHLWNILFDGTRPVFIDFTSIAELPKDGLWEAFGDFEQSALNVLRLMDKGYHSTARAMIRSFNGRIDSSLPNALFFHPDRYGKGQVKGDLRRVIDLAGFYGEKLGKRVMKWWHRESGGAASRARIERCLEEIQRLQVQPAGADWSGYYQWVNNKPLYSADDRAVEAPKPSTPKEETVAKLLDSLRPGSVLDIGCNRGRYSHFAASAGARVVGVDTDELALDQMYQDARALGTNVQALFVNVAAPAEAQGLLTNPFPKAVDRLRSDCVLCLAVVHHLVFRSPWLSFERVVDLLAAYTAKTLIVEFVPKDDSLFAPWFAKRSPEFQSRFDWYSLDAFRTALSARFDIIETHPSIPEGRSLLVANIRVPPPR